MSHQTEAVLSCAQDDGSDAGFLRERACVVRSDLHRAWCDVVTSLRRAANPSTLIHYHPVGVTVAVGVATAIGVREISKPREAERKPGLLRKTLRVARGMIVRSVISQGALWFLGTQQYEETEPATETGDME